MKQQQRQALEGALCCLPAAAGVGALYLAPFALALARLLGSAEDSDRVKKAIVYQ